jgi:peptide/nickel transport system substrate-binding protein
MKKTAKLLALVLALVMILGVFAACGNQPAVTPTAEPTADVQPTTAPTTAPTAEPAPSAEPTPDEPAGPDPNTPLVVGYSPFNSKFSPFFSETAYDQDVWAMTAVSLLASDRMGSVITKGIEGETVNYNGTDYTYYSIADLDIDEKADGTVDYNFTIRDDIKFSDGEPLTMADVVFSFYVYCDPTYDGASTLYGQPIVGMEKYRAGMDSRGNVIFAAGPDGYEATDLYTEEQYNKFWDYYNGQAGADFAQEIINYCVDNYAAAYGEAYIGHTQAEIIANPEYQVQLGMTLWGFGDAYFEGATAADYWDAIVEAYGGDTAAAEATETAGSTRAQLTIAANPEFQAGVQTGESAPNVEGFKVTGKNTFTVTLEKVDATAIYHLGFAVSPMHYYGDASLYDYANNSFGFVKGDLSTVRAKTTQPMGAGPYKFIKFENGVVYFEANEYYFQGCPKTKYLNFQQCTADDDKLNGVITGNIDITDPSFSTNAIEAIKKANGGELNGDKVTVNTVDNLGYGYIGIAASRVNVGGDKASDASKNLRKAIATVMAVYRDLSVDSYYGDRASVINYPISNTSWAAPQSTDDGYQVAFSVDVEGKPIYTSGMSAEEKYAAALEASLGFFEAAGYTVENGKLTAAPEGAKLAYECWIPGDGTGDHPSFMIATEAHDAFATIGFDLIVKDLANSSDLWDGLDADSVDMWCAAWGASVDPDMYQIYYSTNVPGLPGSTGSNHYNIQDPELDELIMDARASTDQAYRKVMYKACLDIIIDWAVEIPVYQRQNAIIFSTERVNLDTITPDITTFYGWNAEIQNTLLK